MKGFFIWFLALVITITTAYYQRISGPTYPKKVEATFWGGQQLHCKLPRTHESTGDCEVRIPAQSDFLGGNIIYRRFPTNEAWDTVSMKRVGNDLVGMLPAQPPAGKLQYYVELYSKSETVRLDGNDTTIIRFKGEVPWMILFPHILLMFLAMLLSNLAGLSAAFRASRMRVYMIATFICMLLGGFLFGPIMQHFAFGAYWTGVPFGWDLTDNKTLIAIVFWILALILNYRKIRPGWIIVAAVVTLIIYSIPHSMFGSELNVATGMVTTGR
jgi:hypothetical protein